MTRPTLRRSGTHRALLLPALLPLVVLVATSTTSRPAAAAEPPGTWPLEPTPEVVHGFDPPEVRWEPGHRGVDLAGRVGQPVLAALPGTVGFAGLVAGRAVVVVDHGATRTTYQPVTASVRRGERVARGQVIGSLAWFGTHCLPAACLHWGLLAGDTYLDPLSLVGGPRPVRLLPLGGSPDPVALGLPFTPRPAPFTLRPTASTHRPEVAHGAWAAAPPVLPGPAVVAVAGAVLGAGTG